MHCHDHACIDSLSGSTLEVRGAWGTSSPKKLAVVGGTGQFTNAQGIVSVTNVSSSSTRAVHELFIRIFYTTIDI
jgi:Dirigent-like protein